MTTETNLAAAAVALVAPYLAAAGTEAAKAAGKGAAEAGGRLLGWLRERAAGRAGEALTDLERDPGSEDNRADLRKQLARLLAGQPDLAAELRALLPGEGEAGGAMSQTVSGDGARGAQIRGDGNTVTL